VLRKGSTMFVLKAAGTLLLLLANVLMNRIVGFTNFGQYVFIMGFVNIVVVGICFGGDTFLKRETSRLKEKSENYLTNLQSHVYAMARQLGAMCIPGVLLTTIFLYITVQGGRVIASEYTQILVALVTLLMAVMKLCGGAFIGMSAAVSETVLFGFIRPMIVVLSLLVLGLVALYGGEVQYTLDILFGVQLTVLFLVIGLAFFLFKRNFKLDLLATVFLKNNLAGLNSGRLTDLLKICFPLALVSSTVILERNIDILMLGTFDGSDKSALYYISTRISAFFLLPLFILNSLALPAISRSYKEGKTRTVEKKAIKVSKYSSLASLVILVFVIIAGKDILLLFGHEYSSAYYPMLLLSVGNLVRTLLGPVQMVGLMCNLEKSVSKANIASLFINIILNLLLIPILGIFGAVVATVGTRLGRSIFLSRVIGKQVGVKVGLISLQKRLV